MECVVFGVKPIIRLMVKELTNKSIESTAIIKINSENLLNNGEISMPCNFKAWKSLFQDELCPFNCISILEHCLHLCDNTIERSEVEQYKLVAERLMLMSKSWPLQIARYSLSNERLCLFLNRLSTIKMVLNSILTNNCSLGQMPLPGQIYDLSYEADDESQLTSCRLRLIRDVTIKILNLQGYSISNHGAINKITFTTKSHEKGSNDGQRYVCGVVRSTTTKLKETLLTWDEYMMVKVNEIIQLNRDRTISEKYNNESYSINMAKAAAIFEMLAVKPTRSILIGTLSPERSIMNMKEALFVLYNTARIASILTKYHGGVLDGKYPSLPDIQDIDFGQLNEEEEWELVYNYILKYPELIQDCVTNHPNLRISPQLICLFLSKLCHAFSNYYRRTRILTVRMLNNSLLKFRKVYRFGADGGNHLLPKMFARLYLLQALQVVLQNLLSLLDVEPITRM